MRLSRSVTSSTLVCLLALSGCGSGDDSAGESPSTTDAAPSQLVVTAQGNEQEINPTDVYCNGEPGTIRHLVGKTDNRPPLVEADGDHFVMVKTGQGEPLRTESPEGVSYTENSVTFEQVDIGGGVLNGTMECTSWND